MVSVVILITRCAHPFNNLSDLISRRPVDQPELLILIKSIYVYSVRIGSEIRTIWKVKVCVYMGDRGNKSCWFCQNSLDLARDDACWGHLIHHGLRTFIY